MRASERACRSADLQDCSAGESLNKRGVQSKDIQALSREQCCVLDRTEGRPAVKHAVLKSAPNGTVT